MYPKTIREKFMIYDYRKIREMLFNEETPAPLALDNGEGLKMFFKQIFAVELDGVLYCILKPFVRVEGLNAHNALVFWVDGEGVFRAVKGKAVADRVFAEYYKSL